MPTRIPPLLRYLAQVGVPPDALLEAAGLDPERLSNTRLSERDMPRIWDAAEKLTGDSDLGIHLGEWVCQCPEDHFDVLAYAVRSCATLGEHYRRMGRYVRLLHGGIYLSLELGQDAARLVHGLRDNTLPPRHPVESMLAVAVLQSRSSVGEDFAPRAVHFAHAGPAQAREQERLFRAPVRYGCPRNELVLDLAVLDRPQRHAEPRLLAVLDRQIEELLSRLPQERSFSGQVRRCIANLLPDGEPGVGAVAAKLRMSPRSLQRRLHGDGTSFAHLLTDLRREMALRYLQEPSNTLGEVAFLLGFAEVSAFHRAFKRWTGRTPAEYRRDAPPLPPSAEQPRTSLSLAK